WEQIYSSKSIDDVSWYQERARHSLQLIESTGISHDATIIDVGAGASSLARDLIAAKYQDITVLDISAVALQSAREQLGENADSITWLEADITKIELPLQAYDVWHDRAVFHFLL